MCPCGYDINKSKDKRNEETEKKLRAANNKIYLLTEKDKIKKEVFGNAEQNKEKLNTGSNSNKYEYARELLMRDNKN